MDHQRNCLRVGAVAIGCALFLRLLGVGSLGFHLPGKEVLSSVMLLGTGRFVKLTQPQDAEPTQPPEPTDTAPTAPEPQRQPVVFTAQDASRVQIRNTSGYNVDIAALLQQSVPLELTGDQPTVLILHTHGSESYTQTEEYTESSSYRTLDNRYNVVSVGAYIAQKLEQNGIRVIHDQTLHDQPSYNGSYADARTSISEYLQQYPSIRLVLDIHRDAALDASGNQIGGTVSTPLGDAAQLMLVLGTDAGGLTHPNWQDNLSLAVKLHALLEGRYAGLCRPMQLRTSRFNQDLSSGALLVEVGAAGNTRQQALAAADILAQGIVDLALGT